MKKQRSAKVFTLMLAAMFWLTQQAWAQSGTQNSQTQNAGPQQSASPSNTTAAPDQASPPATSTQSSPQQKPATAPQNAPQSAPAEPPPPKPKGTTVNTSEAPLQPVTTYPDASGAEQAQPAQNASVPNAPQPQTQQPVEPQGAATAERVPTAGGAAAKPAGAAIAPAKQHRTRSILIKVGAVAAAGVAAGTVYALSRGTSSTPPGANSPIAVPK